MDNEMILKVGVFVAIMAFGFVVGNIDKHSGKNNNCVSTICEKATLTKELQDKFNRIVKNSLTTRTCYKSYTLPLKEYLLFISIYGDRNNVDPDQMPRDLLYQLTTDQDSYRYDPDYKKHYSHHEGSIFAIGNKGLEEFEQAQRELFKADPNRQINQQKAI